MAPLRPCRPYRHAVAAGLLLALALLPQAGRAGPPYVTDDPEPVDLGHWEVYLYSQGTAVDGDRSAALPAVEVNYGALPELQLHVTLPLTVNDQPGVPAQYGVGDAAFGFKYRLVDPQKGDWWPQVGVFPMVMASSGSAARGLGSGRTHAFLPVWLQKDFAGGWSSYGGGGYEINPGPGNKDYWFLGWLVQRQVTATLAIGAEIFHQTAFSTALRGNLGYPAGTKDSSGFNLGAVYDLTEHDHLLVSAGRAFQNANATNQVSYYLGYQATF